MEKPSSKNSNDDPPAGNYAGRRRRLQQDCTVKLFPPITPPTASPDQTNQDPAETATDARKSHKKCSRGHTHTCCCCKHRNKHQNRSRCNSRTIDSALSSCSSSSRSTASSWSSFSSRSSPASSDCSSLVLLERDSSSSPRGLSRSRDVKDVLKRIADELASNDDVGRNKAGGVLGDSRGDPHVPPPSRVLTGVCIYLHLLRLLILIPSL